ncbi:hypothetical protein IFM46972_01339 [Aspergillus udagawae]|uniref:Uncharacterized protein n=1 Tax=Aspergillus udagawae TaxID=91492 RepID=A0A8H3N5L4_9EURO|nr:hypothetical protein IFM46972_01339 [Aspergillus udagawae]
MEPMSDCTGVNPCQPDPNIAGAGVISGFILTGTLTFIASYAVLYLRRRGSYPIASTIHQQQCGKHRRPKHSNGFWIRVLTAFVLQLSDQQLVTGLLLLVCGYAQYWGSSVHHGANNLWTVTDVVCYSSFTHAATLLSLCPYFQRHRKLATLRVVIMYIIYGLWLVVAVRILSPNKPKDSQKLPSLASRFWHAATVIEAIGIMWIYLLTYLPVFLSEQAMEVRTIVSRVSLSTQDIAFIREWLALVKPLSHSAASGSIWHRYNPYAIAKRCLFKMAVAFSERIISLIVEVIFPWSTAGVWLALLWAFSLGALIYSLLQNGLTSSWDFGQLLPVFMILLPIVNLVTSIIGDESAPVYSYGLT